MPDGCCIATGSFDGKVKIWEADGQPRLECLHHTRTVTTMTVTTTAKLVSGSHDATVNVYDPATGQFTVVKHHYHSVVTASPLPNDMVATASADGRVLVWHAATTEVSFTFSCRDQIRCLSLLQEDGKYARGCYDSYVRFADYRSEAHDPIHGRGHTQEVTALALLPDGRVASAGLDARVCVWDALVGTCMHRLQGHTMAVHTLAVLPDGTLASGGEDGNVIVWDPKTGECLLKLTGPRGAVHGLTVLPDGKLAAASYDWRVHVWA
jgi:WD40 repeat protein